MFEEWDIRTIFMSISMISGTDRYLPTVGQKYTSLQQE